MTVEIHITAPDGDAARDEMAALLGGHSEPNSDAAERIRLLEAECDELASRFREIALAVDCDEHSPSRDVADHIKTLWDEPQRQLEAIARLLGFEGPADWIDLYKHVEAHAPAAPTWAIGDRVALTRGNGSKDVATVQRVEPPMYYVEYGDNGSTAHVTGASLSAITDELSEPHQVDAGPEKKRRGRKPKTEPWSPSAMPESPRVETEASVAAPASVSAFKSGDAVAWPAVPEIGVVAGEGRVLESLDGSAYRVSFGNRTLVVRAEHLSPITGWPFPVPPDDRRPPADAPSPITVSGQPLTEEGLIAPAPKAPAFWLLLPPSTLAQDEAVMILMDDGSVLNGTVDRPHAGSVYCNVKTLDDGVKVIHEDRIRRLPTLAEVVGPPSPRDNGIPF